MICVCSTDARLVKHVASLSPGDVGVRQVVDIRGLSDAQGVDLLFIDLKCWKEDEIPNFLFAAMALAEVPCYDQGMRLLRRGIRGYGNRHMHRENLAQAISAVRDGQVWLPPAMVTRMISSLAPQTKDVEPPISVEPLSRREEEVVGFVTEGLANREIAGMMNISVRTVKAHLTSIFAKTGFRDRLELAVKMKRG